MHAAYVKVKVPLYFVFLLFVEKNSMSIVAQRNVDLFLFFIILLNSIQPLDFLVSQWQWYMISIDFVTREIIRSTTDHHL